MEVHAQSWTVKRPTDETFWLSLHGILTDFWSFSLIIYNRFLYSSCNYMVINLLYILKHLNYKTEKSKITKLKCAFNYIISYSFSFGYFWFLILVYSFIGLWLLKNFNNYIIKVLWIIWFYIVQASYKFFLYTFGDRKAQNPAHNCLKIN